MTAIAKNKTVETSRCSGHCCKRFFLKEPVLETLTKTYDGSWDGDTIVDMVILLEWDDDSEGGWFTCRHFDAETNNCQIYDRRPGMCRDYPYRDNVCNFKGCTYKTATKEKTDA